MGGGGEQQGLVEYKNIPRLIGAALSRRVATLHELQTVYGLEDVYNMLEVISIDQHNQEILRKRANNG